MKNNKVNQVLDSLYSILDTLTEEERRKVFDDIGIEYCLHCGKKTKIDDDEYIYCQCENDE